MERASNPRPRNVLFLCTGNSARSIIAECLLERLGAGRFRAFSAGSHPAGAVNPHAERLLASLGYDTRRLRSKSWDEFAGAEAPPMDWVITVCDNAAGELCPVWPGAPARDHWSIPDPAAVLGPEAETARRFRAVYARIEARIAAFLAAAA